MRYRTKIYGHRGASQYAPENSIVAFQMAYDMGADGIELDVQMTRDGHLVVAHDEEISRVSDGEGLIKDMTLEELRRYQFNKTHPEYPNVRIPLLEEVLEHFKQKEFLYNIELKNGVFPYQGMEEKVLRLVKEKNALERTLFSSFYHKSMLELQGMEPAAKVAFLYSNGILDMPGYLRRYGVHIAHPAWYLLDRDDSLTDFHEKGITVNVWTVNSGKEIRRLCNLGVDGIITNKPNLGCEIRDDKSY